MLPSTDEVRVWLVDRGYSDRDLIALQYATLEEDEAYPKEVTPQALGTVTAAKDVSPANLGTVDEPELRERYAAEATQMAEEHGPDDPIRSPRSTTYETAK